MRRMELERVETERQEFPLAGRRVVVAGLARTGLAAVRFLMSRGAAGIASDRRPEAGLHEPADAARTCGNIGPPLLEMVEQDTRESVYAVELSSFQLEGISLFRPAAAVVVNLSPDHLDRYRDYGAYVAAKARIFSNQGREDLAVLNAADADSALLHSAVKA